LLDIAEEEEAMKDAALSKVGSLPIKTALNPTPVFSFGAPKTAPSSSSSTTPFNAKLPSQPSQPATTFAFPAVSKPLSSTAQKIATLEESKLPKFDFSNQIITKKAQPPTPFKSSNNHKNKIKK